MLEPRPAPQQVAADTVPPGPAGAAWLQTRTLLRVMFVILAVAAGLWILYTLQGVLLLVVLAMFFAYLIAPLVELVRRPFVQRGRESLMPRALAIGVVYLVLFTLIVIGTSLLLPRVGSQMTQLARQAPGYAAHARDRLQAWRYPIDPNRFPQAVRDGVEKAMGHAVENAEGHLSSALFGLIELASYLPWLVLIPILAFFFVKDAEGFRRSALLSLPGDRMRGRGARFFQDLNLTLAAYIRAQLTACLLIGTICTIGFVVIGLPYALVLGIFAGLLEFIPLVGPLVVALSASLVASFLSLGQAIAVLLFLGVLRVVHDYVVYPRLIRQGIHLHPLAVILGVLCGAELAGIAGIFLAIPVIAVASVSHRHWLELRGGAGLVADLLTPTDSAGIIAPQSETLSAGAARQSPTGAR